MAGLDENWRRRIKNVEVGTYNQWTGSKLSDHCPVIVDISAGTQRRHKAPKPEAIGRLNAAP